MKCPTIVVTKHSQLKSLFPELRARGETSDITEIYTNRETKVWTSRTLRCLHEERDFDARYNKAKLYLHVYNVLSRKKSF